VQLLIASTNPGKIREFRQIGGGQIEFGDLTQHPGTAEVAETGHSFLANACLKASGYARQVKMWALADDSGLVVDALDGKPGIFSGRWAAMNGAGEGDADNNALLLRELSQIPDQMRTARFVCALALADPRGRIVLTATDSVEGRIIREPIGDNGFGYDPLFFIDALGKTTAQLPPEQKHRISHRGKALARLWKLMQRARLLESAR
jgi:non-canonical purine NTP pyrophosphatase (RdgB/HAM1 family)